METLLIQLVTVAEPAEEFTVMSLLSKASPVVQAALGILVLMSLISWYIIVYKWLYFRRAIKESDIFLKTFWRSKRLDEIFDTSEDLNYSPVSHVFREGYKELTKLKKDQVGDTMHGQMGDIENIERSIRRSITTESIHLESMTGFLATTASAAPFVGLFGTVWGIMVSFLNIAREGNASLTTVAPGIAEALIATAVGLVAAIPAVIAYNGFVGRIRGLEARMENFGNDFLNIVKRHFFK